MTGVSDPPGLCPGCGTSRVAWVKPQVDFCYACLPGGPFAPPACTSCGSGDYFSQGLCARCHPGSPQYISSCRDCLAYGVLRRNNWLCWGCRSWRAKYPAGECPYCGRTLALGRDGSCRLCWQQALHEQEPGEPADLDDATRYGHQLFFANLHQPRATGPGTSAARAARPSRRRAALAAVPFTPGRWKQYPLFWMRPSLTALRQAAVPDDHLDAHLRHVLREHAARHGWSTKQVQDARRSLSMVQAAQHTPGSAVKASEVEALASPAFTVQSALEILDAAGLLDDDREPLIRRYFRDRTAGLPPAMTAQLETWFDVMLNGAVTPPRRRPRHQHTIRLHVLWMQQPLRTWAGSGITTLAEISPGDIRAVLPPANPARSEAYQGLRSLFHVLKQRKQVFSDPTTAVPPVPIPAGIPLPLDTEAIRQALDSPEPAVALAVALAAFHALTVADIRNILLTDVADGRLSAGGRDIPLAGPVRTRLAAYLDHRARTWPGTINPYLLINRRTAPRTCPAGVRYPWAGLPVRPQALREDRILAEIHASGGDVRRICDLFGMSVTGALRYLPASARLTDTEHPGPHTPGPAGR